ncbi:DUF4232 domain-containing protein [Actinacidiphila acidipaludis]|uniref:DUF4232 domain-containing protein n=1 Tax=Actinacidiphila acidipaludis TaxID=2873382 RepID=A0ABS7QHY9_9ACTN|nr:DUF4232 domain-containing protein [Streptomyces acidipaludis]MBY8882406.1 DUF4232 domain-containing protein [Streptomyces acidipaludis]
MRRDLLVLSTAATFGALLLTACGSRQAASRPPADTPTASAGTSSCTTAATPDGPDGSTGRRASSAAVPAEQQEEAAADGVRLTGAIGCQAFEVTNTTDATATFTITFDVVSDAGAALSGARLTVASVPPGRTVRRAVEPDGPTGGAGGRRVRIVKVRSVPTAQAPSASGPCPASGVRLYADDGDAAMGLRVVGLHLGNCGTRPYTLGGYPRLALFDAAHRPVGSVAILHGGDAVATGTGADGPPRRLVLRPGQGAHAELVWRNTTGPDGAPVDAPYVQVVAEPGAAPVMVTPELDLGTTGRLAVGPWQSDTAARG